MPRIYYVKWIDSRGIAAITLPPFGIWIEEAYRDDPVIHYHELWHWYQYKKTGNVLVHYAKYLWAWIVHGFSYRNNPYEVAAYAAASGRTWDDVLALEESLNEF